MNYGGMSWEHSLEMLAAVPGLKLVYGTGNPGITPDFRKSFPYPNQDARECYEKLRDYVVHVHIKDGMRDPATGEERYFFPDEGICWRPATRATFPSSRTWPSSSTTPASLPPRRRASTTISNMGAASRESWKRRCVKAERRPDSRLPVTKVSSEYFFPRSRGRNSPESGLRISVYG
jgi:hypothetical protein